MSSFLTPYKVEINSDTFSAPAGHRKVIINFKSTKSRPTAPQPHCVAIATIEMTVTPEVLKEVALSAIADIQDEAIREEIETFISAGNRDARSLSIDPSLLTANAIASSSTSGPGKQSAAKLSAWFDACLSEPLGLAIAAKMNLDLSNQDTISPELLARWNKALEQHKGVISSLSAPAAKLPVDLSKSMLRAVSLAAPVDRPSQLVLDFLNKKLTSFTIPKAELDITNFL